MADEDQDLPELGERTPAQPPPSRWYNRPVILAVLSLLVGILIGAGGGVAATKALDEDESGNEEAQISTSPTTEPTVVEPAVVVPRVCLVALDQAERGMELLSDALRSLGDLEVDRLNEALRRLEQVNPEFVANVRACQEKIAD